MKKRIILLTITGSILLILCTLMSISIGAKDIPFYDVVKTIFGKNPDSFQKAVISARIPRTVFGLLAGSGLSVSGLMMQAITRNPIADPGILGVNTGASLFVVCGIAFFGITTSQTTILLAFAGRTVSAVLVYSIASAGGGGANPMRLALAGTAVSIALSNLVNTIMLPDSQVMKAFRFWQIGSISGATWKDISLMLPYIVFGFVLAVYISPALNSLALGDESATSLGVNVKKTRSISAVSGVILCACVTALAGPIGFVGLMVPHIVRMIAGADMRALIPLSGMYGSILLLSSDILGRILSGPGELEVGIITAIIGAPVFIYVIRKSRIQSL